MTLNICSFIKKIFLIFLTFQLSASFAQVNNALKFDGVNDYVNLNSLQSSMVANANNFTIEFWMKADRMQQTLLRPAMFAINEPNGENRLLIIMGGANINDGFLMIYDDGGFGIGSVYTGNENIGDNLCHHIAYTFQNGTGKVYLDGILKNTHNAFYGITINDRYSIAQEWDNSLTSQFYNGVIDELRIWNYSRSNAEILATMNTEITGSELGVLAYYSFNQGVSGGNNSSVGNLLDTGANANNGILNDMTLAGSNSNFILSECTAAANITATTSTTINTNCNGTDCDYTGPSILINELMISPISGDGSISGQAGAPARGEWIELYNPNLCEPADISCFYLGNNTAEGTGGFVIPAGTIVPPAGFAVIRGVNATPVASANLVANGGNVLEIIVPSEITDPGVCCSGTRVWFPNSGGWFAF